MCIQSLMNLRKRGIKGNIVNACMLPPDIILPAVIKPITDFKIGNNMYLTHTGVGCTIVRRDVMEAIPFRISKDNDEVTGQMTFSDTFFYIDLLSKRIEVLLDNRMICKHIKNWK